jgi:beta-lactam-binding protein with PASTA domain
MNTPHLLTLLVGLALLASCGGDEPSAMPDIVGERLDVAKSDLSAAGVSEDKVEVVGGGSLGVVDESNWTVCEQAPPPGSAAEDVRVLVDRVCVDEESPGGADTPATTADTPATTADTPATTAEAPAQPPSGSGDSDLMTLPNAVGMQLQLAQDTMQAAGFFVLTSHDATGQNRLQVSDRNWKVCDQAPPGGSEVSSSTEVAFSVVRVEESCP